jgi:hypothetical protein
LEELKSQLAKPKTPPPPQIIKEVVPPKELLEELEAAKRSLEQKSMELSTIKEVVRLECQERMHLMSVIEDLRSSTKTLPHISSNTQSCPSIISTNKGRNTISESPLKSKGPPSKDKAFEDMMLAAALKKNAKLQKQSAASPKFRQPK